MCQSASSDWKEIHQELRRLAKTRAELDHEEAQWLLAGLRSDVHRFLGYGSYCEYLGRLFGYQPREVRERLRVARALEVLPATSEALAGGDLSWSATRELTRVATADTEQAWLDACEHSTVRQIEKMVGGRSPGDLPTTPADESARTHVLRFEVNAETFALWREAAGSLRATAAAPLDEEEVLMMMARQVLAGPSDEGRSSYQVAMTVCDRCGKGWQQGRGEQLAVDAKVVEMAECDAQKLPATHVGRPAPRKPATQTVPPATRRAVLRRDGGCCVVPGCRASTFVDVHHLEPRSEGGSHAAERLVTLCGAHHRAVHRGRLHIDGEVGALRVLHADGSRYGSVGADAEGVEVSSEVFAALRHSGFKETAARHAVARALTHVGHSAGKEELLREALRSVQ